MKWPELAVSPPYAQLMGLLDGWISRLSAIDHLSMFSGERDQVAALRRLLGDKRPSPRRTLDFETFSRGRRKKLSCNYLGGLEAFLEETFSGQSSFAKNGSVIDALTGRIAFAHLMMLSSDRRAWSSAKSLRRSSLEWAGVSCGPLGTRRPLAAGKEPEAGWGAGPKDRPRRRLCR